MKAIYIIFFFIYNVFSYEQYVPPMFKICLSDIPICEEDISIYSFYSFETAYFNKTGYHSFTTNNPIYRQQNKYIYILTGNFNPKKGDVFRLNISKKKSGEILSIYIRVSYDLAEGEVIEIKNLEFINGNYWFDMCAEERSYHIKAKEFSIVTSASGLEYGFAFEYSKKNKISNRKLKKFIRINKCG